MQTETRSAGGIINYPIRDISSLQAAYMPFIRQGGLFIPSNRQVMLGDDIFVVATLPESSSRIPLAGKVIWIFQRANAHRPAGFAIQLTGEEGQKFKDQAEKLLTGLINAERPTYTL